MMFAEEILMTLLTVFAFTLSGGVSYSLVPIRYETRFKVSRKWKLGEIRRIQRIAPTKGAPSRSGGCTKAKERMFKERWKKQNGMNRLELR